MVWLARVWAILSAFVQMSSVIGDVSTWQMPLGVWVRLELTAWAIMMTMQPSPNNENRNSLRASSPFKRYREKSRASGTQNKTREQDAGKENESSWFPSPLTTSPLTCTFACHSKWMGCFRSITFLVNRTRSLFEKPVYVENSKEKFELFTN